MSYDYPSGSTAKVRSELLIMNILGRALETSFVQTVDRRTGFAD